MLVDILNARIALDFGEKGCITIGQRILILKTKDNILIN